MSDVPIEPQDYLYGVKVVDIGDLRVARGKARRERSVCPHRQLVYDRDERRIWCQDCETTIDAFDAFEGLVGRWSNAAADIGRRRAEVESAEAHALISRAAKVIDKVWRGRSAAPCCPHCNNGILPEDVVGGVRKVGREFELKKRARKSETAPSVAG